MTGYTKGPWVYRPLDHDDWGMVRVAKDAHGYQPVICQAKNPSISHEDCQAYRDSGSDPYEANARLIAAAPELLEMLDEVFDVFDGMCDDEINEELKPRIAAVLNKARGQA